MEKEIAFIYFLIQTFFMIGLSTVAFKFEYYQLSIIFFVIAALNLLALSIFIYDLWAGN